MTVNGGTGAADDYSTWLLLSDAEGKNSVKFVCETQYFDEDTMFPYANEFTVFQTSVSQLFGYSDFSFLNGSLTVNGTTYKNNQVSNASAVSTGTSLTINFTVDGADYVFKYSM